MAWNCEKCKDTGAYVVNTEDEGKGFGGYSTYRCVCRMMLAPREGTASWWASETVLSVDVTVPIFNEMISIEVSSEVPMSADNYRVLRRGNRYYPTLITIETPPHLTLHADTARNLARALMQAAEAVDKIDDADVAPCGHWFPCECALSPLPVDAQEDKERERT